MSRGNIIRSLEFALGMPFNLRQRRLAETRSPMSKEDFIDQVSSTEIGKAAAAILWEKLDDGWVHDEFSPYPDDDFGKIYGMAEEELDEDTILDIILKLNLSIPDQEKIDKIGPINTPRDLIMLIETISGRPGIF